MFLCEDFEPLNKIQRAEKCVKEEWEKHERSRKKREVEPCSLRCTFVLEPMIASFNDAKITPELTEIMQTLVRDNTWFSRVSFWLSTGPKLEATEHTARKAIGQLMASIFGGTRRSYELATSRYHRKIDVANGATLPLQLGTVNVECDASMKMKNFESMCSAITRTRVLGAGNSGVSSSCRGTVDDRDATLKTGARIHYKLNKRGQPPRGSHAVAVEEPITSARIFSDDGSSEYVNILVPCYGRCYVQRTDLEPQDTSAGSAACHGVTDLKIEFERDAAFVSNGIVALWGDMVDVRFNFSEYHAKNLPVPELTFAWDDVAALANALAIVDSPLAKSGLRALLDMLAGNQYLEYLDVVVPFGYFIYLEDFRRHHLEPLKRSQKLSMDTKIAFLSVISMRSKPAEPSKIQKRRSTRSAHARRPLSELNQNVLSTIFAFAAPRVVREVYLRDPPDDRWEEPEVVPI
ncbi:hypothetical protein GQ600_3134 [Phytophthora cactorum]|nr:hypothetical protein GQ600_3134 [Phytophthora cactorum]